MNKMLHITTCFKTFPPHLSARLICQECLEDPVTEVGGPRAQGQPQAVGTRHQVASQLGPSLPLCHLEINKKSYIILVPLLLPFEERE